MGLASSPSSLAPEGPDVETSGVVGPVFVWRVGVGASVAEPLLGDCMEGDGVNAFAGQGLASVAAVGGSNCRGLVVSLTAEKRSILANASPVCNALGNVDGVLKALVDSPDVVIGVAGAGESDFVGDGLTMGLSAGRSLTAGLIFEASLFIGGLLCREVRLVGETDWGGRVSGGIIAEAGVTGSCDSGERVAKGDLNSPWGGLTGLVNDAKEVAVGLPVAGGWNPVLSGISKILR